MKDNYTSYQVEKELQKLAADEPKEFGAFNEPLIQQKAAEGNLQQSYQNIGNSYQQGYNDLMKNTAQQEAQAVNQSLNTSANPFAIQQVRTDTANKQANSMFDIRRKLTQDKDALNLQKRQAGQSFSSALSNEELLLKALNRLRDKESERNADAGKEFNQSSLQNTMTN